MTVDPPYTISSNSRNLYRLSILIGLGILIYALCVDIPLAFRTRSWPSTNGTVNRARIATEDSGVNDGQRTFAQIDFRYEVEKKEYKGRWEPRKSLAMWGMPRSIVNKFPPGTQLTLYYSAGNPSLFTMERGLTLGTALGILLGVSLLCFGFYKERQHNFPWTWNTENS